MEEKKVTTAEKKEKVKKYYRLNQDNKTITLDSSVKPTEAEKEVVQMYINAGYIVRFKSEKRAKAARERAIKRGFGKKETK